MIPYFEVTTIILGPLTLRVWGIFVAAGILSGAYLTYRLAKKYLLSEAVIGDLAIWALVGAFIGARVFYIIFYNPAYFLQYPLDAFKIWQGGESSLGGFFGAAVAVYVFAKIRKLSWDNLLPYLDIGAVGLWLGWGIGRVGCFLIHDHVGTLSHFILAVNYPGGARHDLGLYDSILGFVLFAFSLIFYKRLAKYGSGFVAGVTFGLYAFVRFWLDFLRATDLSVIDVRYAGLTPAQWGMAAVFLTLTFLLINSKILKRKI
ncbi:MAG: prolipoprotein diacylglyceryl transferase [bacterium]|nr:prolipoprotein diacylglyceryl transferase [bacterium]